MIGRKACLTLAALAAIAPIGVGAQTFEIDGVAFSESVYLEDDELQDIASDYTGRPISFNDLQDLLDEIQASYLQAGIVTARPILPPQEIRDGVLKIELVEATVSSIEVEGFDQTEDDFLTRTLQIEPGTEPDFESIEQDLRIFDIAHDIRPTLSFRPGPEPGTTIAVIRGEEPDRFQFTGSVDNFGSAETGEIRGSLFGRISSVTGWRDTLNLQLQASSGAYSGSASYSRPIGGRGGRILASASYTNSRVIGGPFTAVDILSNSAVGSLGYSQPFRVRPASYGVAQINALYEQSDSDLEGTSLSSQNLTELVVNAAHVWQGATSNASLSFGAKAGNADSQEVSETEGFYYLLFGSGGYARRIGEQLLVDANLNFQYAEGQNLPVSRLFTLGGATSVRGYPVNVRSGDSGALLKLQVSRAIPYRSESQPKLTYNPLGFADLGVVVPFRDTGGFDAEQDVLASIGGGVRIDFDGRARGLVMLGVPLKNTLGFEADSVTAYVGIDYDF
ncbi:MAG: ShlB/FhaC/HecB family hemolysin secretion/activation protein [Pseudomonadota bacterium]